MRFLDQPIDFSPVAGQTMAAYVATVSAAQLVDFSVAVHRAGRRLVSLWGSDERDRAADADAGFALHVAFDLAEGLVCLSLPLPADNPAFPDLASLFYSANRLQRAACDLLGLRIEDGEDTRPWLRHANWPADYFPLRRDTPDRQFPAENEDYPFVRVAGEGVHEIAVGPIHAGIIEPGHFRFSTMGERTLRLEERLGWKHKGIDRRFIGMPLAEGALLAGRISGDTTVAYAWAYSQAAEAIAEVVPPPRAAWLRALLLERERIANHLSDLGYLGNDVALAFGLMQFMRLKEEWVRLNARLFGHRFTKDRIVPGGVTVDIDAAGIDALHNQCDAVEKEVRRLKAIYDEHAGLQDRFLTTGTVTPDLARRLGLIGLAGRASGQAWDLRCNHPCLPYDRMVPTLALERRGDVAARAAVRFTELFESLALIRALLDHLPEGETRTVPHSRPNRRGFGWVEGWRGDVLVALETGADGKIRRCHCHDPSWHNWPALEHAVIDNIVPDFPLINKSFNLSYSGPDL